MTKLDPDLRSLQEVRDALARAKAAQKAISHYSQAQIDRVCEAMAHAVRDHAYELARKAVDEWPRDPRLLVPLFYLAGKRPDEGWERRYALHLRRCLPDRPLVLAQAAARIAWETGAIAIYAPNHPADFWKIVDRHPIEFAQMERWRKIDRKRFEGRFEAVEGCAADLYRNR